jgi:hypothetical protein
MQRTWEFEGDDKGGTCWCLVLQAIGILGNKDIVIVVS